MKRHRFLAMAALLAGSVLHATSYAAVVVNDTWLDGTDDDPASPAYSENGVDADVDGNLESVWFQGGDGTLNPAGPGGPLVMMMDTAGGSSSWTTYFTPEGSEVALANPGDKLRLTWVFTTNDVNASNTSQNLRIALVDSPSASRISANGTPGNAAYTGYGVFGNMGETFDHSDPFELVERNAGSAALLSSSGAWEDDNLAANGGADGNPGYTDDTEYTFIMELTRLAGNQIDVSASMRGGNLDGVGLVSASGTDVDPTSFSFDTFALRPSSAVTTTDQFDTSLLRVEFLPIPEPGSLALIALAALLSIGRTRP